MTSPDLFVAQRPSWRAPTRGEHVCVGCKGAANLGLGQAWYCRACAPADFFPHNRRGR